MNKNLQTVLLVYIAIVAVTFTVSAVLTVIASVTQSKVDSIEQYMPSYVHSVGKAVLPEHLLFELENTFEFLEVTNATERYCPNNPNRKKRSKLSVFLLAFFVGGYGVDRFYTGYVAQGVFKILTLGGLGIWSFVDCNIIVFALCISI